MVYISYTLRIKLTHHGLVFRVNGSLGITFDRIPSQSMYQVLQM